MHSEGKEKNVEGKVRPCIVKEQSDSDGTCLLKCFRGERGRAVVKGRVVVAEYMNQDIETDP